MSAEQYNTTERSSQDKKSDWERSLVGQHACFLHQNLQQAPQHVYTHHQQHHHLGGGSLEARMFQATGAEPVFGNLNPTIDMQSGANAGQGAMPLRHENSDAISFSHARFGMPPLHASSNNNHKGSVNIAFARPRHPRGAAEEHMHQGKTGAALSMSTSTKSSTPRRMRNSSLSPLTVRPIGTKDRHSKVRTAKGLRDRRVRLSAPTAIQFFDVQDRLGYDQPSKAVDWLIKKARAAIDELAPVEGVIVGDEMVDMPVDDWKLSKEHDLHMHSSFVKVKDEEQSLASAAGGGARAESRAKARERARERAKEKTTTPVVPTSATSMETASTSPAATMPAQPFTPASNFNLLPEFFLLSSQFRQQFDELHRPSDLSSMLTPPSAPPPAPHFIPFASPFFPTNSAASSFMFSGDGPPLQHSASPTTYNTITTTTTTNNNNNNNTPNSPRGTLQSIFSNPAAFSMQAHVSMPPLMMMGGPVQAHAYGATTLSSIVRDAGGHDHNAAFRQSSAELGSPDSNQHSHIPMRIRGMELGSRVEETRITPSSMQADYQ